jgi:hypothetical protein
MTAAQTLPFKSCATTSASAWRTAICTVGLRIGSMPDPTEPKGGTEQFLEVSLAL